MKKIIICIFLFLLTFQGYGIHPSTMNSDNKIIELHEDYQLDQSSNNFFKKLRSTIHKSLSKIQNKLILAIILWIGGGILMSVGALLLVFFIGIPIMFLGVLLFLVGFYFFWVWLITAIKE